MSKLQQGLHAPVGAPSNVFKPLQMQFERKEHGSKAENKHAQHAGASLQLGV